MKEPKPFYQTGNFWKFFVIPVAAALGFVGYLLEILHSYTTH